MNKAVLDTDTLSAIMRRDSEALSNARAYLSSHLQLSISIVTRYEILRGLNAKNAASQAASFHALCQSMEVLPLTDDVIVRAADIYGTLHRTGQLVGDAGPRLLHRTGPDAAVLLGQVTQGRDQQLILAGEVEVDDAVGQLGAPGHVAHGGVGEAALGDRADGGFDQLLAPPLADRGVGSAVGLGAGIGCFARHDACPDSPIFSQDWRQKER